MKLYETGSFRSLYCSEDLGDLEEEGKVRRQYTLALFVFYGGMIPDTLGEYPEFLVGGCC